MNRTLTETNTPYTIRLSKKAIYARISANHKGIEVTIPEGTPLSYAENFAEKKRLWIIAKHQELSILKRESQQYINTRHKNKTPAELKRLLKIQVKEIIVRHHLQLGVPKKLRIKEQISRWGSCSSKGSININWKLIFAPSNVLEYVVVHELCHMTHMNHSQAFWDLVEKAFPSFQASKDWLKLNGQALMSIE